jgi:hypothetical protein
MLEAVLLIIYFIRIKSETRLLICFLGHLWQLSAANAGVLFHLIGV